MRCSVLRWRCPHGCPSGSMLTVVREDVLKAETELEEMIEWHERDCHGSEIRYRQMLRKLGGLPPGFRPTGGTVRFPIVPATPRLQPELPLPRHLFGR